VNPLVGKTLTSAQLAMNRHSLDRTPELEPQSGPTADFAGNRRAPSLSASVRSTSVAAGAGALSEMGDRDTQAADLPITSTTRLLEVALGLSRDQVQHLVARPRFSRSPEARGLGLSIQPFFNPHQPGLVGALLSVAVGLLLLLTLT